MAASLWQRCVRLGQTRPPARQRKGRRLPRGFHPRFEPLEDRRLLAVLWDGEAGDNNWNSPLNWSTNSLPGAADDAIIGATFAAQTITHASLTTLIRSLTSEATVAITGGSLTITDDSTINNALNVSGTGSLTFDSLTLGGTGTLTNAATVNFTSTMVNAALDNQGLLLIKTGLANAINGSFSTTATSTLRVRADNSLGPTTLTVANGFINNGLIELTSFNGAEQPATLIVTSGTLTNAATRTIDILVGTGGARTLNAQLDNQGTINVGTNLTINAPGADHLNSGTINVTGGDLSLPQTGITPTFSTSNAIAINSPRTFVIGGGTFNFNTGATLTGGGTLVLSGSIVNLTPNLVNATTTLVLVNATVNGPGALINATGRTLNITGSTINAPLDNQGLMQVLSGSNVIGSAVGALHDHEHFDAPSAS